MIFFMRFAQRLSSTSTRFWNLPAASPRQQAAAQCLPCTLRVSSGQMPQVKQLSTCGTSLSPYTILGAALGRTYLPIAASALLSEGGAA